MLLRRVVNNVKLSIDNGAAVEIENNLEGTALIVAAGYWDSRVCNGCWGAEPISKCGTQLASHHSWRWLKMARRMSWFHSSIVAQMKTLY